MIAFLAAAIADLCDIFLKNSRYCQEHLVQGMLYRSSMIVILRFSIFTSILFLNFFKYFFKENHNYLKNKEIKIKKNSKKNLIFKKLLKSYKQNNENLYKVSKS